MIHPVVLDARMIGHSGIGAHIRGLLEGWREAAPDFRPTLLGDPAVLADNLAEAREYPIVRFRAPIYGWREQLTYPARRTRGALLHCPHYNIALRHRGPLVVTIHDLIHVDERWGQRSRFRRLYARMMLRAAVRRAQHVFAVSQATADEMVSRFGIERRKVSVVHNAPAKVFREWKGGPVDLEPFRREWRLPADYFLTVGLYKPHKNLDFLLETLRSLWENGALKESLVVAGLQEKERAALESRLVRLRMTERVHIAPRLPADRMPALYAGARALVHPSLLEGFGLPIVEAQAVGTPVVASRASAMPEVAGEGALYFDPHDRDDLAGQLIAVVQNEGLRRRLVEAGRRNAARFSWRASAEKVLSIYERIA